MELKKKLIILILIIGAALIFIFQGGRYSQPEASPNSPTSTTQPAAEETGEPRIFSTNPNPLDKAIILPTQTVEIAFNYPLENVGEFKHKISPKPDEYKIELSEDKKVAKIIPVKPFTLGTTYSLEIGAGEHGTKFDGGKRLSGGITYNFKTIDFKGS